MKTLIASCLAAIVGGAVQPGPVMAHGPTGKSRLQGQVSCELRKLRQVSEQRIESPDFSHGLKERLAHSYDFNVTLEADDLNTAFTLNANEIARALRSGKDLAANGKPDAQAYNPVRTKPRWFRGKGAPTSLSEVVAIGIGSCPLIYEASRAAKLYEPCTLPPEMQQGKACAKKLIFAIRLVSSDTYGLSDAAKLSQFAATVAALKDPKNASAYAAAASTETVRKSTANSDDVEVVKFLVGDDKRNLWAARRVTSIPIPTLSTIYGGIFECYSMDDLLGPTVVDVGMEPYSAQHPYCSQSYVLCFPLFDRSGRTQITKEVKSLTIHMVCKTGEQIAVFNLTNRGLK